MSLIHRVGLAALLISSASALAANTVPSRLFTLSENSQLAFCEMRRLCSSQCIERAYGRHGTYCVRWSYVCRTVCEPAPYYPHYHHWRHGYWW